MDIDLRKKFASWVSNSFRDTADHGYVAARTLYRAGLYQQFAWQMQQSIEKYLKAAILMASKNANGF